MLSYEGMYGSFHLWINVWVAGKSMRSLIKARYTLYPYTRPCTLVVCTSQLLTNFPIYSSDPVRVYKSQPH